MFFPEQILLDKFFFFCHIGFISDLKCCVGWELSINPNPYKIYQKLKQKCLSLLSFSSRMIPPSQSKYIYACPGIHHPSIMFPKVSYRACLLCGAELGGFPWGSSQEIDFERKRCGGEGGGSWGFCCMIYG